MTLLEMLKENRWTVTEFTKRIGVSRQYFYQVANGKEKPSERMLVEMALLLQTNKKNILKTIKTKRKIKNL